MEYQKDEYLTKPAPMLGHMASLHTINTHIKKRKSFSLKFMQYLTAYIMIITHNSSISSIYLFEQSMVDIAFCTRENSSRSE